MQDYNVQLSALQSLKRYIEDLKKQLESFQRSYGNKIIELIDCGVPRQVVEEYSLVFWQPKDHSIMTLIQQIEELDIPYLQNQINIISHADNNSKYTKEEFKRAIQRIKNEMIMKRCQCCDNTFEVPVGSKIVLCPKCFKKLFQDTGRDPNCR